MAVESLVIIGSSPAGYTASISAGRAQLKPIVFEGFETAAISNSERIYFIPAD